MNPAIGTDLRQAPPEVLQAEDDLTFFFGMKKSRKWQGNTMNFGEFGLDCWWCFCCFLLIKMIQKRFQTDVADVFVVAISSDGFTFGKVWKPPLSASTGEKLRDLLFWNCLSWCSVAYPKTSGQAMASLKLHIENELWNAMFLLMSILGFHVKRVSPNRHKKNTHIQAVNQPRSSEEKEESTGIIGV